MTRNLRHRQNYHRANRSSTSPKRRRGRTRGVRAVSVQPPGAFNDHIRTSSREFHNDDDARTRAQISRRRVPVKLLRLRHGCRDRRAHTHTHTRRTVRCREHRPTRFRSRTPSYRDAPRAHVPDAVRVIVRSVRIANPSRECRSGVDRGVNCA